MSRPAPTAPHDQPQAPRPTPTSGLSTETSELPGDRRRSRTDRRLSLRRSVVVAVRQEVVGPSAGPVIFPLLLGQSADLGLGGMRIQRRCGDDDPELPVHTPLCLSFQLPDTGDMIELRGEVVFDRPTSRDCRTTGVRFFDLPDEIADRLRDYLADPDAPTIS